MTLTNHMLLMWWHYILNLKIVHATSTVQQMYATYSGPKSKLLKEKLWSSANRKSVKRLSSKPTSVVISQRLDWSSSPYFILHSILSSLFLYRLNCIPRNSLFVNLYNCYCIIFRLSRKRSATPFVRVFTTYLHFRWNIKRHETCATFFWKPPTLSKSSQTLGTPAIIRSSF